MGVFVMDRNNRKSPEFGNVVDGEEEVLELDDRLATRCKETKETSNRCPNRVAFDDEGKEGGGRLEEAAADDDDHEDEVDSDYKKTLEGISLGLWDGAHLSVFDGHVDGSERGNAKAGGDTDGGGVEEDGHADNRFMHGRNRGAKSVDDSHADKGDDMVDPDYKMWLDALREDGISYSVELAWTNQISEVIRYHTDDGVFDGTNVENMETMDGSPTRKNNKPEKVSSGPTREMKTESVSKGKRMETKINLRRGRMRTESKFKDVHSKKRKSSVAQWKAKRCNLDPASGKACGQTGKRLRTEIPGSTNRRGKRGEDWDGADESYKIFLSSLEKDGNPFLFRPETNKRPVDQSPGSTDCEGKHGAKWNTVDKSYEIFLKCLKKDGESLVFMRKGGKKVIYETSSSESEVYILEADPFVNSNHTPFVNSNHTPFVASKVHVLLDEDDEDNFGNQHSQFREKLVEILKQPYNGKEFKDLYHKASHRLPKQQYREMRNGREVRYQTGLLGKSYLDQHKDLAKMIVASAKSNPPKALNLLRGLFYWLQNVAQEESFMPWRQPWCLNVLPNSD